MCGTPPQSLLVYWFTGLLVWIYQYCGLDYPGNKFKYCGVFCITWRPYTTFYRDCNLVKSKSVKKTIHLM